LSLFGKAVPPAVVFRNQVPEQFQMVIQLACMFNLQKAQNLNIGQRALLIQGGKDSSPSRVLQYPVQRAQIGWHASSVIHCQSSIMNVFDWKTCHTFVISQSGCDWRNRELIEWT